MAVDLRVNLGGVALNNPLVIASSDLGCHLGAIKEAEGYGAGAFITKGCISRPDAVGLKRKPRHRVDLKKMTISGHSGSRRLSLEQAESLISRAKKEVKIPVGANLFVFNPGEEEKYFVTRAAERIYRSGADFIELDCTGNLPVHFGETGETNVTGESFADEAGAQYLGFIFEVVRSVKNVVGVPVMAKVAYENINVPVLVQAMTRGGADIIDIGNAAVGLAPGMIDVYHPEKKLGGFVSASKSTMLNLFGEPLRAVAQGYLVRTAKLLRTPILACGGITSWQHVVEGIMCGATATAACTIYMLRGFEVLRKMESGLRKFMEEQGYATLDEFRGVILDRVALNFAEIEVRDAVARIDPAKCNGCGLCLKPGHCGLERRAITMAGGKAVVEEAQCVGCETCASICPTGAVAIILTAG
ncbi:MAG: 4Fe-4S binding protein [Chloroflexi bacterium]|nr:4Fe-4S binding protein [Chloroflexota bacterium]